LFFLEGIWLYLLGPDYLIQIQLAHYFKTNHCSFAKRLLGHESLANNCGFEQRLVMNFAGRFELSEQCHFGFEFGADSCIRHP